MCAVKTARRIQMTCINSLQQDKSRKTSPIEKKNERETMILWQEIMLRA